MKKHLRKLLTIVLVCASLLSTSIPAAAAGTSWHNWGCGKCETVNFTVTKSGKTTVLTQKKGSMALYNVFKRKVTTSQDTYGSYRVTIVMVKNAKGKTVNKVICNNKLWSSGSLNIKLDKGTYRIMVRSLGYVTPSKTIWGPYSCKYWNRYPQWKTGK